MNDIERRALIGAAGLGAIAALSKAGPLNPPAGAVAPTGRTTDEIYNKIPAVGGSDGRTPIPGGNASVTLSQSGSYVLTGPISVTGTALTLTAAGINIDLNGFTVSTTSTAAQAVVITGTADRAVIRNGTISGGIFGISVSIGANGVLLEDLRITGAKFTGIAFSGSGSHAGVVRRCIVTDIGAVTLTTDGAVGVTGIIAGGGLACRVEDCAVAKLIHNAVPPGAVRGITASGVGSAINGCTVGNDTVYAGSTGLSLVASVAYRDNTVAGFTVAYSSGTDAGGNA